MTQTFTADQAYDRYLQSVHASVSAQTATAYRQAWSLFSHYLADAGVKTAAVSVEAILDEHILGYFDFLQHERSVETEHLYSRHPIHRIGGGGVPFAASETVTPLTS